MSPMSPVCVNEFGVKSLKTSCQRIFYGYQWWTRDDDTLDAIEIHRQMIDVDPRRKLVASSSE